MNQAGAGIIRLAATPPHRKKAPTSPASSARRVPASRQRGGQRAQCVDQEGRDEMARLEQMDALAQALGVLGGDARGKRDQARAGRDQYRFDEAADDESGD